MYAPSQCPHALGLTTANCTGMHPRPARQRWLVRRSTLSPPLVQRREARDLFKPLLMHPGRNVARTMKHAPNVDAVLRFDVEHEVRKPPDRP